MLEIKAENTKVLVMLNNNIHTIYKESSDEEQVIAVQLWPENKKNGH